MFLRALFVLWLTSVWAVVACAQARVRGHVFLPESHGATVLSTHLHAQAARLVAMGDFLESAAVARQINLESDRIAMENSVLWVETYFRRREVNKEYRDELRLDYQERKLKIGQHRHQRIVQSDSSGEPSDEINFMIDRLIANPDAYRSIALGDVPSIEETDFTLTPNDLSHILLSDTSGSQGSRPLRPTDPKLVTDHWPRIFQRTEFDEVRTIYDKARRQAAAEIKREGQLSVQTLENVQQALRGLEERFEEVYVWPRMKERVNLATFTHYRKAGEDFLRTQAAGTLRAFAMNDPRSYATNLMFDGENLIDLLRYCAQNNLRFAPPAGGDEGTYSRLYQQIRLLYLFYLPDAPDF